MSDMGKDKHRLPHNQWNGNSARNVLIPPLALQNTVLTLLQQVEDAAAE